MSVFRGSPHYEQDINRYPDFTPIAVNSSERKLFALTDLDSNTKSIYEYNLDTGEAIKELYSDPEFDLSSNVFLSRDESNIEAVYYSRDKGTAVYFNKEITSVGQFLEQQYPEDTVTIVDYTEDYAKWVFYLSGDRNPGQYLLYNKIENKIYLIGENMSGLNKTNLAQVFPIEFESRDGKSIAGYITFPNTWNKGIKAPLVVFPHGGPWARDEWEYDPYVQFMANRGFVVLQVNFRSSSGYGVDHYRGGIKKYGKIPVNDLIDGVRWTLDKFQLDEDRICIVGASYGGYAALRAMTQEPDLFRCGISVSGFGDLEKLLEDDEGATFYDFEVEMMGDPGTEIEIIRANSPIYELDKIQAPILIVHGKLDSRVKFHHAIQIEEALKKYDKPYETLIMRDEGHSIVKRRNRENLFKRIDAFLNKHIGNSKK